jgi:hypothetical protein
VKFLTTLPDRVTRAYGERLLAKLRKLFRVLPASLYELA